jgi:hypothetical protein
MDIDEVADELYEVAPEDFIALRTARQDEAKAEGDKALATQIGALPKPSTAAWVCNLLVRAHRQEIEGLVELGTLLRDAQENLAGDELKALNRQRGQLLTALTRQAAALARQRGHAVSTAMAGQVEETLRAAMADPDAGEALLTGRLTSPMSYSGLGTVSGRPDLRLVPPPSLERRPASPAPARPAVKRTAPADRETAADRRAREREEQRREAEELAVEHADLTARVEDLADQMAAAERDAAEVAAALKRAQRRSAAAEREAAEAAEARDRAAAHVEHLEARAPE